MNAHPERRRAAPADGPPLRLLVVDDDPHSRAYLAALAQRAHFAVESAEDGETGLAMLTSGGYDVVIIDHEMPRITGIDLMRALHEEETSHAIFAIMLTAHDDIATKLAALEAGFDDFLAKSSSEAEILAKIGVAQRIATRQRTLDVAIRELYGLATRDELTGVFNRRFFMAEAERLLAAGSELNVVLFDLDEFKHVNDTHGHLAGDRVLRDVAALFHRRTRPEDIVARIGGDEFVMALPHAQDASLEQIASRLVSAVESMRWTVGDVTFHIGVSTGVASSRFLVEPSLSQLLDVADRDMYRNKSQRRKSQRAGSRARLSEVELA